MNTFLLLAYITGGISVAYSLMTYVIPNRKMNLWLKAGADVLSVINLVFIYLATNNSLIIAGMVTTAIGFFRECIFALRNKVKAFNNYAWPVGFSIIFLLSLIFTYKNGLSLLPAFGSVISSLTFYALDQRIFKGGALASSILYVTYYAILIPSSDVLTVFSLLSSLAGLISSAIGLSIVLFKLKTKNNSN